MKVTLAIRTDNGRDLHADLPCECPDDRYKDDPVLAPIVKRRIYLWGYNDANFFDNVNKEPREHQCKCGRKRMVQWTRDGVIVEDKV